MTRPSTGKIGPDSLFICHKAPLREPPGAVGMTDRGTQPLPTRPDPALCARFALFVRRGREGNSHPYQEIVKVLNDPSVRDQLNKHGISLHPTSHT